MIERDDQEKLDEDYVDPGVALIRQVPIGIIFARIIVVSGIGFSAALAIFFLIGAIWLPALAFVGVTLVFLFLMFFIERGAEGANK